MKKKYLQEKNTTTFFSDWGINNIKNKRENENSWVEKTEPENNHN